MKIAHDQSWFRHTCLFVLILCLYVLIYHLTLFAGLSFRLAYTFPPEGEILLGIVYASLLSGPIALALMSFVMLLILIMVKKLSLLMNARFIILIGISQGIFFTFQYDLLLDISKIFYSVF